MGGGYSSIDLKNFFYTAKADATYVSTPFRIKAVDDFIAKQDAEMAKKAIENHLKSKESPKEKVVADMIAGDPAAPKNLDTERMTQMIMKASQETGVDSLVIASIAQRETHFNQNLPVRNGSGVMQLTSISIKDMFLRPKIYDDSLKPILAKYGCPENLIKAMRKDPELNIKLGAILYKAKLKQAKGDEKKALELYNGSPIKKTYAQAVMANINNVRQSSGFSTSA